MEKLVACILVAALLGACSTLPDVEYGYYLTKSQVNVSVTQTLDCTADQTALIVVNTATVTPVYSADTAKGLYHIKVKDVEGGFAPFADSEMSFSFFDDGRLKSINQSTTGQGETVIKNVVSLASALGGGPPPVKGKTLPICDKIKSAGQGKPVSLVYSGTFDLAANLGRILPLGVAPASRKLFADLGVDPVTSRMQLQVGTAPADDARAKYLGTDSSSDYVPLTLQSTADVRVDVTASGSSIWTGTISVPLPKTYVLPILKAALFGKQSFSLTLSDSGAITTVDFAKNSGAAGALSAGTAVATAAVPETPAAKAADLKGQADLIAQQQRLARCQATPAQCQ